MPRRVVIAPRGFVGEAAEAVYLSREDDLGDDKPRDR